MSYLEYNLLPSLRNNTGSDILFVQILCRLLRLTLSTEAYKAPHNFSM